VFVVHINRADRYDRRIDTSVHFADNLNLDSVLVSAGQPCDSYMKPCDSNFELQAVCFHQGQSARVGHYYAAVRDAMQPQRWWGISDAWIHELEMHPNKVEEVQSGPRASLLFYVRKGLR
jgi:uncharacterized UBP type Zn finger protein